MDCGQLNEIQKINENYELEYAIQACLNPQYIHHNEYDYLYFKKIIFI